MSVLWLTSGQPGSGKTYSRVKWLIEDFLPNNTGLYITNLPLKVDLIADHVAKNYGKSKDDTISRIVLIPQAEFDLWVAVRTMQKQKRDQYMSDETYPAFQYFAQYDLTNAHIAIDEFHKVFGKGFSTDILKLWGDWFSEIRKTGATFEAITQCLDKLSREYVSLVGLRVDLVQARNLRDPIFKIMLYDWYQLRAGWTGVQDERVIQTEYIKTVSFTGGTKWKEQHQSKFTLSPEYWCFYESYTKSTGETGQTSTPADQYGKKIWKWFLRRNLLRILWRGTIFFFFVWLLVGGGLPMIFKYFIKFVSTGMGGMLGGKSRVHQSEKAYIQQSNIYSASPVTQAQLQNNLHVLKQLEQQYDSDRSKRMPVLFFDNCCWLKNSERIYEGYKFKGGVYDGKTIKKINQLERFYELDSGECVTMYE